MKITNEKWKVIQKILFYCKEYNIEVPNFNDYESVKKVGKLINDRKALEEVKSIKTDEQRMELGLQIFY